MEEGPELFDLYQAIHGRVVPLVTEIEGLLHLDKSNIYSAERRAKLMLQQLDIIRKGLDVMLRGDANKKYIHEDNAYVRRTLLQIQKDYEKVRDLMKG